MKSIPKRTKHVHARIEGDNTQNFTPQIALIAHSDRQGNACCTIHNIGLLKNRPHLLGGVLATEKDIANTLELIKNKTQKEKQAPLASGFTARDILYKDADTLAWLRPPSTERILIDGKFKEETQYSGKPMAIPAMIFVVEGNSLKTFCPLGAGRPGPETEICVAPFPNTSEDGRVCLNGGFRGEPENPKMIQDAENIYFNTSFTHPVPRHPYDYREFRKFWKLACRKAEAGKILTPKNFINKKFQVFKLKDVFECKNP